MGILNVTPDSFYDGGRYFTVRRAVAHAERMQAHGADLIDIGGESTRPGAEPVSAEDEMRRVLPVIEKLHDRLHIPLCVDTTHASVAQRALDAGVSIVNDISAGTRDVQMFTTVARYGAGMVLMHCRGNPQTMQRAPRYRNVIAEIDAYLTRQVAQAVAAGIERNRLVIDPGIGFGKTARHNLILLSRLNAFCNIGLPILVGPSCKSFIGKILSALGPAPVAGKRDQMAWSGRIDGTSSALAIAIFKGARIVRVHDVATAVSVVRVADAILKEKISRIDPKNLSVPIPVE